MFIQSQLVNLASPSRRQVANSDNGQRADAVRKEIPRQDLVMVAGAAVKLGRTEKAIRRMVETGKLKPIRIDGRIQFEIAELDRLIEEARNRANE